MGSGDMLQLVNKDGEYAAENVESFVTATGLDRTNVDYTIVAIMGPQSSGESWGIWLSQHAGIRSMCLVVPKEARSIHASSLSLLLLPLAQGKQMKAVESEVSRSANHLWWPCAGKSTLLNAVFGTKFVEMNAMSGRQQTTRGIWMARSPKIPKVQHRALFFPNLVQIF